MAFAKLALMLLASKVLAQSEPATIPTPTFFISLNNVCEYNNAYLDPGPNFADHGSLCAYVEETHLVYSCPAPDGICWNEGEPCTGGNSQTAATNQTLCAVINQPTADKFCCNSVSGNCTQNANQGNNCWSWFPNPNRNVNMNVAKGSASRLMASATNIDTSSVIIVSTYATGGWVAAAAATTTTTSGPSGATTTPAESSPSSAPQDDSGLSGGAIAGIAVGAIIGGIAIGAVGFFFWYRSHKAKKAAAVNASKPTQPMSYYKQDGTASDSDKHHYVSYSSPPPQYNSNAQRFAAELNSEPVRNSPVELPSNMPNGHR